MIIKPDIKLLADCPEHVPALAQLWYSELGQEWIPKSSVAKAVTVYNEHLNTDAMPLTYVAIINNEPIGMVSLRDNDGIRDDLTPWLGSLIVHPDYRSQGIGNMLIEVTKQRASEMGYTTLYLFALDRMIPNWYKKLGWHYIGMDKLYHHPVTVMEIEV